MASDKGKACSKFKIFKRDSLNLTVSLGTGIIHTTPGFEKPCHKNNRTENQRRPTTLV
jgi:hypothetical protein